MAVNKVLPAQLEKQYWVIRLERNGFFMHVMGSIFRWTPTPYDATFFESEEDARAYLDISESPGDLLLRVVPMMMVFPS